MRRPCAWPSRAAAGSRTAAARPQADAAGRDARQPCEPPHGAPEASEVLSDEVLERRIVQHLLSQQSLQPAVLLLQSPQLAGIRYIQPAELGLPFVESRAADPVPPAQVPGLGPTLVLLQNPNKLPFRKTALAHRRSPRDRPNYQLEDIPGSRSATVA